MRFSVLLCGGICSLAISIGFSAACGDITPAAAVPEYTTSATIKDIMLSIVDPSADVVWESVKTIVGPQGIQEIAPKTDEEWEEVRRGAIRLAEATNLLMIPGRRVARPGEKSEAPGIELEPHEMDALISKDRAGWLQRAKALHEAAELALKAIDAKDVEAITDVGERMEHACEGCHFQYWYPNQVLPPGYEEPPLRDAQKPGASQ
jgi:hypothetical protein